MGTGTTNKGKTNALDTLAASNDADKYVDENGEIVQLAPTGQEYVDEYNRANFAATRDAKRAKGFRVRNSVINQDLTSDFTGI